MKAHLILKKELFMKIRYLSVLTVSLTILLISIPAKAQWHYIAFGSDVHSNSQTTPNYGVSNLDSKSYFWNVTGCDFLGLVGDQGRRDGTPIANDYNAITSLITSINSSIPLVSTKGNHDIDQTYNTYTGWGYIDYYSCANIIALSSEDFTNGYWYNLAYMLSALYNGTRDGKIVVVMSHYPLHSRKLTKEDGVDESVVNTFFDLLQSFSSGENPLDIVYVWGHTHGKDDKYNPKTYKWWDDGITMCAGPGETMLDPNGTYDNAIHYSNVNSTLNFTYLNAGYLGGESTNPNTPAMSRMYTGEGGLCYYLVFERTDGTFMWRYRQDAYSYEWCN
jgi:predicted MPP superfamily phosphohydrolase